MPTSRSLRARASLCVAALSGLALVGACRGDSGPPLKTWITEADTICHDVQKEAEETQPVLRPPTLIESLRRSLELSKKEVRQLRDLERPVEKRDDVRQYLQALDDRISAVDNYMTEVNGSAGGMASPAASDGLTGIERLTFATQRAADLATSIGLHTCLAGIDMTIGGAAGSNTQGTGAVPSSLAPGGPSIPVSVPGNVDPSVPGGPTPNGTDEFGTEDLVG